MPAAGRASATTILHGRTAGYTISRAKVAADGLVVRWWPDIDTGSLADGRAAAAEIADWLTKHGLATTACPPDRFGWYVTVHPDSAG